MSEIIIVGSGLAGVSAAKSVIKNGFKPLIIDAGYVLDTARKSLKNYFQSTNQNEWSLSKLTTITKNNTTNNKIPKKSYMGSDFFYGINNLSEVNQNLHIKGNDYPAFSFAKGGLAMGWGSAILPISQLEYHKFPMDMEDLFKHYSLVIKDIHYTYNNKNEELFKSFKSADGVNILPQDFKEILNNLKKNKYFREKFFAEESRLLTNLSGNSCIKCGQCMSGCFFDLIHKPDIDLDKMLLKKEIDYLPNTIVEHFEEENGVIKVFCYEIKKKKFKIVTCKKIIIAAGAIQSAKIFCKSYKLENVEFDLLNKNGIITPILNFNLNNDEWPNRHTLPLIFFSLFNGKEIPIYSQLSKVNEIVIKKIKGKVNSHTFMSKILSNYIFISHLNFNSDLSDSYKIKFSFKGHQTNIFLKKNENNNKNIRNSHYKEFSKILKSSDSFTLDLLSKYTESQHNGGTMPMRKKLDKPQDVTVDGNTKFSKNIFFVDSAVLPYLTATPIGYTIMANASRISSKIF